MDLEYGPVVVEDWFDETRIGYYDDSTVNDDDEECAVVFFGEISIALSTGHHVIPFDYIRNISTDDLWRRRKTIRREIGPRQPEVLDCEETPFRERYISLLELAYVDGLLMDRLYMARFNVKRGAGARVFISHSSKDKQFAKRLSVDLANAGHEPWLDEWNIKVGESIPSKISDGLQGSSFVIVVLSRNSVSSNWVEREWQAKYWSEVQSNEVMVLPLMLEECDVPYLLQTKKYANFIENYNEGLEEVLGALFVEEKE